MASPLRAPDLLGKRVRVRLAGALCDGAVRFYGETHWHATLLGVELNEPRGTGDGTHEGVFYFAARPKHGVFLVPGAAHIECVPSGDAAAAMAAPWRGNA